MKTIKIFTKGERVRLEYEVESVVFKNGELYYTLKEPLNGTYLNNAYTSDELIPVDEEGEGTGKD